MRAASEGLKKDAARAGTLYDEKHGDKMSDSRVDAMEVKLREMFEVRSGYRDEHSQAALLAKHFRSFDRDGSGVLDFDEFARAMLSLNFVGVQAETEALFDRYDSDLNGVLSYAEFARAVTGCSGRVLLNGRAQSLLERVRASILEAGGKNGIRTLGVILRRMDQNGNGVIELEVTHPRSLHGYAAYLPMFMQEFRDGIFQLGVCDAEPGELERTFRCFDRDQSGKITIDELMRGLRGSMPKRRILLVKKAFALLDTSGDGKATVEEVERLYDASQHPEVLAGRMKPRDAMLEMMSVFEQADSRGDGVVTWHEFLEYYKDLSAGILNDDEFELMVRNAWHLSGGVGWSANSSCRRVLATFRDGSQRVLEIENDLGIGASDTRRMMEKLAAQGYRDIKQQWMRRHLQSRSTTSHPSIAHPSSVSDMSRELSPSPSLSPEVFVRIESPIDIDEEDEVEKSLVIRDLDPMQYVLEWEHVTLKVEVPALKTSKGPSTMEERIILDDVNGVARSGEFVVVMGPSGAGKTSLLDCVAKRNRRATGQIVVNGTPLDEKMKSLMTYVVQDDLFYETLTVREHLIFQAKLRLGGVNSQQDIGRRVSKIMRDFGLAKVSSSLIGGPTSGLDSFMAESVVKQLLRIARQGKMVLATIHQPSSELFTCFDRLYLMANGNVIYDGLAKDAVAYFSSQGYSCPAFLNPADYFMRQLAVLDEESDQQTGSQRVQTLIESWKTHKDTASAGHGRVTSGQTSAFSDESKKRPGGIFQLMILSQRNTVRLVRDKLALRVSIMQSLMTAIIVGLVYLQLNVGETGVQNFVGVFFFMVASQTMITANGQFSSVPLELALVAREYESGLYYVLSWYAAKNISELPMQILLPMVFFVPVYFMIGINHGAFVYLYQQIIVVLVHSAAVGFGYMISCVCRRVDIAPIIGIVLLMPMVLLAGLLINSDDIPVYLVWLGFLSPLKYGFEGLMKIFWEKISLIPCSSAAQSCTAKSGDEVLATYRGRYHQSYFFPHSDLAISQTARTHVSASLDSVCGGFRKNHKVDSTQTAASLERKVADFDYYYDCCHKPVNYIASTMDTSPDFVEQMNYVILASRSNASKKMLNAAPIQDVWFCRNGETRSNKQLSAKSMISSNKAPSTPRMLGKRKEPQQDLL
ncbi:unnamed protein product [Phytophthora lilii]|uniref:Unnamed protein product n=1 Tax=Phytophthora lilii TaxID=2077276 RepID=A0A9W6TBT8_9STRA|nr:unnamed protein product [Phytophthora lilii]